MGSVIFATFHFITRHRSGSTFYENNVTHV